jgi:hypothetical protein
MPIVSTRRVNTFWVAANVLFDLGTGKKNEVLMLVNKVEDATLFSFQDAQNYYKFISERASNIMWSVEPLPPDRLMMRAFGDTSGPYVIKGVQHV